MALRILVLDTPDADLWLLGETFHTASEDADIQSVQSVADLLAKLSGGLPYDLVVLDYILGDGSSSGAEALARVRQQDAETPVVAVAEKGSVELTAQAIKAGATDFLVRGGQLQERVSTLLEKVRNILDLIRRNRLLGEQNALLQQSQLERYHIVGESPQILSVLAKIARVAKIPRPVLIVGERGTGKELVARAIHLASGKPNRPFVVVNCAAATDTLLESELFGHEKGSFTGADSRVPGKFEQANGGTLFLDEIGNMSLAFQQKILRAVEYGTFTRVGGTRDIRTTTRIVAATNANIPELIGQGKFLQDLYDRLAFEVIEVPPLRQREGDIELLARHFLSQFTREIPSLGGKRLSREALDVLKRYSFPGNVREMKNIIERAAYRDTTNEINPEDIDMLPSSQAADATVGPFEEKVEQYKKQLILKTLSQAKGNQAQAARLAGLSYHQFRYYYRKYAAGG